MAKGRTWCISFDEDAKKAGDVKVKWKVTDENGNERTIDGTWEGYTAGMKARDKRDRFFNRITSPPMNQFVEAIKAGNLVCFQLKDNAPYADIAGVEVGDQTGQKFNVFDDIEKKEFLETLRFGIEGTPKNPKGTVGLGIGRFYPFVMVSTHVENKPLSIDEILENLISSFNEWYAELGWKATKEKDKVVVPKVPCEDGARCGTDDEGLESILSVTDPHLDPFPKDRWAGLEKNNLK